MPRALLLVLATMSSADFCLIIQTITDVDAVVFRHFFIYHSWRKVAGPISESAARLMIAQLPVKQISPDKNALCHYATASFTLTTSDHWALLSCANSPPAWALYGVSVRQLVVLLPASSGQTLAGLPLPFASG